MPDEWVTLAVLLLAGLLIGLAKTGISTLGMMTLIVMTVVFPAKESAGIMLPALIAGDLLALILYRRHVVWKHLITLVPWVLAGIVAGYFVLRVTDSEALGVMMGMLIVTLVVLQVVKERLGPKVNEAAADSRLLNALLGMLAGFATMIGNVAGVIMAVYLMGKRLPKDQFVGTGAWFFLFVNVLKVPFYVNLGMIDAGSLVFNAWMLPAVLLGAWAGARVLRILPQRQFQAIILLLGAAGGIRLLVM